MSVGERTIPNRVIVKKDDACPTIFQYFYMTSVETAGYRKTSTYHIEVSSSCEMNLTMYISHKIPVNAIWFFDRSVGLCSNLLYS